MAIHHIPLETKSFIIKTIKALKVQNEITDKDINDLARLKEKGQN